MKTGAIIEKFILGRTTLPVSIAYEFVEFPHFFSRFRSGGQYVTGLSYNTAKRLPTSTRTDMADRASTGRTTDDVGDRCRDAGGRGGGNGVTGFRIAAQDADIGLTPGKQVITSPRTIWVLSTDYQRSIFKAGAAVAGAAGGTGFLGSPRTVTVSLTLDF